MTDYEYDFAERVAIMTENGKPEQEAIAEAIYQVRARMVADGLGFGDANLKVMGIKQDFEKGEYSAGN